MRKQSESYNLLQWKKATAMIDAGKTMGQIAIKLGITERTAQRIIQDYKKQK